jgi:hypothetical protein
VGIQTIWRSPTVRTSIIYGVGGLGFAFGNILLARGLDRDDFAWFALILVFSQLSFGIGPFGVDTIVNRYPVDASREILVRVLLSSSITAAVAALVAVVGYGLPSAFVPALIVFCIGISTNKVSAAIYRSREHFGRSLFILQIHNFAIAIVAVAVLLLGVDSAFTIVVILASLYVFSAAWSWRQLMTEKVNAETISFKRVPWAEGFSIVATSGAVVLMIQLERLTIPILLNAEALATFAVLAAVVGSPYRILQMSVGFTLLPRLRRADGVVAKRSILFAEAGVVVVSVVAGSAIVWFLAQIVIDMFVGDKYPIGQPLILAGIIAGTAKVLAAYAQAAFTAVTSARGLKILSINAWVATLLGTTCAYVGAGSGFEGIIYGVSVGWVYYGVVAAAMAAPHFRLTAN